MKKITFLFTVVFSFIVFVHPVRAETQLQNLHNKLQQERQQIKNKIENKRDEIKNATGEAKKELIDQLKDSIKIKLPKLIHGKLNSINGMVLTVMGEKGIVYTVYISSDTQLRRRYGAVATISEFSGGDELAIMGHKRKISDTEYSETEIDAKFIRNLSIQRRNAVFNGNILSKETNLFTIQTQSRGIQTVYFTTSTIYTHKDQTITYAELQIGDKVIVKGELWDRALNKIDAKKIMKIAQTDPSSHPIPSQ